MEQLLTTNVAWNLYWLGRYLERIESSLLELESVFDTIIDVDKDAGVKFYQQFGITLSYDNASDFLDEAIFGEHLGNLAMMSEYVRENAIICRSQIDTAAFGEVIELYELFQRAANEVRHTDFRFIDRALSLISEIWGNLTRRQNRQQSDYFIRLGKLVEKVDYHLCIGRDKEFALTLMDEIDLIVEKLAPNAEFSDHTESDLTRVRASINAKINKIIVD